MVPLLSLAHGEHEGLAFVQAKVWAVVATLGDFRGDP